MAGPVHRRPRRLTANEVGAAADTATKMAANGKTQNAKYRNALAAAKAVEDNPAQLNVGNGLSGFSREIYKQPGEKTADFVSRAGIENFSPTVISDTNIRDRVIPKLNQEATDTLYKYDQNRGLIEQGAQVQADKDFERTQATKTADPFSDIFGTGTSSEIDPVSQKQLDILDRMSKSSDASTRMLAERNKELFDRQRAAQNKVAAQEQGNLGVALNRMGARYTPGAFGQAMATAQRANLEKLSQIDDDDMFANEQLRQAQENKDFELVGQKLDILKGIRDERIKVLEDYRSQQQKLEEQNQKDVNDVLKSAAENGAPPDVLAAIGASSDASEAAQAASGYLATGEYADYVRAATMSGVQPVDAGTYYARKIYGDNAFGGGDDPFSGDVPFAATINTAASMAGSVTGEKSANKQMAELAQSGDYPALLQRMEVLARKGMGATMGTDVATAQNQIKALNNMSAVLKQYQALGGDMGFFKGTLDTVAKRVGQLAVDPQFASISTQLTAAFQQYRQTMTGAAFGANESASYKSVFPSSDKTFELNAAVMDGLKNYYTQNVNDAYSTQLGEGYTNLKDYVDQGLTPTGKKLLKTETDAQGYLIDLGNQDPALRSTIMQIHQQHPEADAYDILQVLGIPTATSNEVSLGGNRPQRNNNPLNIKASDVTLAYPGVVGTDPSPAADGGEFLKFKSPADGLAAARRLLLNPSYQKLTVNQALKRWSNNGYGGDIVPQLSDKRMSSLTPVQLSALVDAMAAREGFYA